MSIVLFLAAMQIAPPPIDPILIPERRQEADVPARVLDGGDAAPDPETAAARTQGMRLLRCIQQADSDAQAAIAEGARWLVDSGGIEAELCVGAGYEAAGSWMEAEQAYGRAATLAASVDDPRHTAILASVGRMALARGEPAIAKTQFDRVLADTAINDEMRGNVLAERARAHVGLDDGNAAQADLQAAQGLLPNDAGVWLLSATLARRQGNLDVAGDFIDRALELDQTDPAILLEAGNIAIRLNAYNVARQAWSQAAALGPESASGQAATRNIERLDALVQSGPTVPVELPEVEELPEEDEETGEPEL